MEFNLDEEIRDDYKISSEMKKVWAVQLDLIKKFLEVCEKYNLKCWAEGGTLLGAVRHKGYIPWDDDIDMVMFRDDYEKLLEIGEKEFQHPYFLQHKDSDKGYYRTFARLRNSNTTALLEWETKDFDFEFNQGIFIDIFVLDGVPSNPIVFQAHKLSINYLRRSRLNLLKRHHTKFLPKMLNTFLRITGQKSKPLTEKLISTIKKYKISDCDKIGLLCFRPTKNYIRQKSWYNETVMLDFENIKLPCPCGYDAELKNQYGNYMKPVKAPTNHGAVFFDTDKPYIEYLKKDVFNIK